MENTEKILTKEEREQLREKFQKELATYVPDWKIIVRETQKYPASTCESKLTSFCEKFKELMKKRNLTYEQTAQRLGYSGRQSIYKIVNGKFQPSIS